MSNGIFKFVQINMKHLLYPSLVLIQPRKTCPCLTERLLMGGKESNQTKQIKMKNTTQQPLKWKWSGPIDKSRTLLLA